MTSAASFLGASPGGEGSCRFDLGEALHGAFGGVFGGAVAAATVLAARPAAPDRRPFSLHCTFVRSLSTPTCTARTEVVSSGRSVTTVAVSLHDANEVLAARATVTFAAHDALHPFDAAGALPAPEFERYEDGSEIRMGEGVDPPIVEVMEPRMVGYPGGGFAHGVRIPWNEPGATAEAACMAADFCVGVPVGATLQGRWVPMPNPDLSVRFVDDAADDPVLVGVGRLGRIERGIAGTQVEVWSPAGTLLAIGLSSTVLLGGSR